IKDRCPVGADHTWGAEDLLNVRARGGVDPDRFVGVAPAHVLRWVLTDRLVEGRDVEASLHQTDAEHDQQNGEQRTPEMESLVPHRRALCARLRQNTSVY